jgi:hypothetical protein
MAIQCKFPPEEFGAPWNGSNSALRPDSTPDYGNLPTIVRVFRLSDCGPVPGELQRMLERRHGVSPHLMQR